MYSKNNQNKAGRQHFLIQPISKLESSKYSTGIRQTHRTMKQNSKFTINSYTYNQQEHRALDGERTIFSTNGAGKNGFNKKVLTLSHTNYTVNFQWIIDLKVKGKIIKNLMRT